jgi:pimeloyl-ACP methyl ester carboxylesterase
MPFTENGGVKIYWDETGEGDPLLLIMGLGWASNMWHRTRPTLSARFRTIAFDNRGAGRSSVPPGPYTIAGMASDAAAVLDGAGIASAHIVGASMGGMIAQEFALQYPARVRSLVLACTAPGGPEAQRPGPEVTEILFSTGLSPDERARAIVPFIYDAGTPRERIDEDLRVLSELYPIPEGFFAQIQAILAWEGCSRLHQIAAPTLVIHGVNDRLVPVANADLIARHTPSAKLVRLANAGHIFFTDQPADAHKAILEFLPAQ